MIRETFYWYDERTNEIKQAWTSEYMMSTSGVLWAHTLQELKELLK